MNFDRSTHADAIREALYALDTVAMKLGPTRAARALRKVRQARQLLEHLLEKVDKFEQIDDDQVDDDQLAREPAREPAISARDVKATHSRPHSPILRSPKRAPDSLTQVVVELDESAVPSWDPFVLIFPMPAIRAVELQSQRGQLARRRPLSVDARDRPDSELVEVLVSKAEADGEGRYVLSAVTTPDGAEYTPPPEPDIAPDYWPSARVVVHDLDGAQHAESLAFAAGQPGVWVSIPGTDLRILATARVREDLEGAVELEIAVLAERDNYVRSIEIKADSDVEVAWCFGRPFLFPNWLVSPHDNPAQCHLIRAGAPLVRRGVMAPRAMRLEAKSAAAFAGYGRAVGAVSFSSSSVFGESKVPIPRFGDEVSRNGARGYAALEDKAAGRFDSLRYTISSAGTDYPLVQPCGPFHPSGARSAGGTGGEGIDPFSGYQLTHSQRRLDWLQMEATCDRLPFDNGAHGSTPKGWECPYESNLRAYAHHDRSHGARAFTSARAVAFQTGSRVAAGLIQIVAKRYRDQGGLEVPTVTGQGHTHAHREKAWLASSQALAHCLNVDDVTARAELREWARGFADWAIATAMESGVTHRSHYTNSHWNPPAWEAQGGPIPDNEDAAKTFMVYLVAVGMFAVGRSILPGRGLEEIAVRATDQLSGLRPRSSTPHYVTVAPHGSLKPYAGLDDSLPNVGGDPRHAMSALALAFLETGDAEYLRRAGAHADSGTWQRLPEHVGAQEGGWHSPCNQSAAAYAIAQEPRVFVPSVIGQPARAYAVKGGSR